MARTSGSSRSRAQASRLKGQPLTSGVALRSDAAEEADELAVGDIALWVHISGERPTVRMRDPNGETARSFRGFQWFPIDDSYRVTGRFIKDPAPREVRAPNQLGDIDVMQSEGVVEFRLNGQTVRLRPMTTRPKRFWFIFRDGTSGKETYETARFLYSDLRDDGTTVLDFNQAYNPPCAFNPFTTCPIPLPENRLKVRIPAGEKAYAEMNDVQRRTRRTRRERFSACSAISALIVVVLYLVHHGDAVGPDVDPRRPLSERGREHVARLAAEAAARGARPARRVAQRQASRPSDGRGLLARLQRARVVLGDARPSARRSARVDSRSPPRRDARHPDRRSLSASARGCLTLIDRARRRRRIHRFRSTASSR